VEPIEPETSPAEAAVPGRAAPGAGRGAGPAPLPALDPVDLALLMKARPERSAAQVATRRYVSLAVVLIVFVVLIVVGVLMASHIHTTGSGASGVVGTRRPFTRLLGPG
jgi:hypothetical protein